MISAGLLDAPINPSTGVKLNIRAITNISGTTNTITYITIPTSTSLSAQQNNLYPLDVVSTFLNITGMVSGSEVKVYRVSDSVLLASIDNTSGSTFTYNYNWIGTDTVVNIIVFALGYQPVRFDNQVLGSTGLSLLVQPVIDRVYNNPQ
jgi:hypothetical protein